MLFFTNNGTSLSFLVLSAGIRTGDQRAFFYWADRDVNAGKISWWGVKSDDFGKAFNWEMPGRLGDTVVRRGARLTCRFLSKPTGCVSGKQDVL